MVQDDSSPSRDLTCSRVIIGTILGTILGKTNGQSYDEDFERDNAQPARKAADRACDTSKNVVTTVTEVDDMDVRDGSLLLLRREANGRETCMMVFSPAQWLCANVDPV